MKTNVKSKFDSGWAAGARLWEPLRAGLVSHMGCRDRSSGPLICHRHNTDAVPILALTRHNLRQLEEIHTNVNIRIEIVVT